MAVGASHVVGTGEITLLVWLAHGSSGLLCSSTWRLAHRPRTEALISGFIVRSDPLTVASHSGGVTAGLVFERIVLLGGRAVASLVAFGDVGPSSQAHPPPLVLGAMRQSLFLGRSSSGGAYPAASKRARQIRRRCRGPRLQRLPGVALSGRLPVRYACCGRVSWLWPLQRLPAAVFPSACSRPGSCRWCSMAGSSTRWLDSGAPCDPGPDRRRGRCSQHGQNAGTAGHRRYLSNRLWVAESAVELTLLSFEVGITGCLGF